MEKENILPVLYDYDNGRWDEKVFHLLCPVCGYMFNHMHDVELVPGNDSYEAGWHGRGDLAVISVVGECSHAWELCVGFHKGNLMMFARKSVVEESDI